MRKSIDPTQLELLEEKVIKINRVAKVVTGGRRFRFNALVAIGDGKGHVGIGLGKALEVSSAVAKGKENAKKNLVKIPVINGTIPHEVQAKYGAAKVILRPATPGTGVIAGGAIRAIMESLGVRDVLSKSLGSNNSHNVVKATMLALSKLKDPYMVAHRREKTLQEIFGS
ncbi:MAG: 30S ribosomal protein S5 [Candidatus Marinimicrobia bacterium ADurb.Bin030]|nr:30S ribosomal protein S5 [Candidatus Neomarinimicrobiota bacterium]OQC47512.1 MAG: 30S ribosomal protein S5 [Candidatus Marinimicrobia bacterium ADurb.Bin030]NLA22271.1 30S ribosomal protein S5 [Candidatus Neomarinimicrobiota bacterium]HOO14727.1 30S ribosomal protein S5 [Candidatus Neomarinimicrobiota bacterium]HPB00022.1 30S ribosomal protein S5 [Candidatus Neomarinimicrobiota bacterium]